VLLTLVVPAAHAEADVEDGPLPELRGQVVLLVWVGDKGVVGCHHCHVQMNEILKEGRSVGAWITSRYYLMLVLYFFYILHKYSHLSFQWLSTFQCVYTSRGLLALVHVTSICLKPH